MTVIATARAETPENGPAAFNPRVHLRQVAELIGEVFANELDASGRTAIEEMQTIGRWSPVLGGLLSSAFFADFVSGYVWLENGRVIGNVTLQAGEASGTRWRISNVAVRPEYRGRGIALTLMRATLREIARRGGSWAVLQVRVDNPTARRLYERLGFGNVCQEGVWRLPMLTGAPRVPEGVALTPLGPADWQARLELARTSRSPLCNWVSAVAADDYRPGLGQSFRKAIGEFTGLQRVRQWGVWENNWLVGDVAVQANAWSANHRLDLAVQPAARGRIETALVAKGLSELAMAPAHPILAHYTGDLPEAIAALEDAGFRGQRVLITMRRLVSSGDTSIRVPGLD